MGDSYICCPELVPVSGIKSGVWSSPHVELNSLLTSTSGESIQALFLLQSLNELLGEQPHVCWVEVARDSKNECPMEGVPSKGRSGRRGMAGGRVLGEQVGLLKNPGAVSSPGWVACTVAGVLSHCHLVTANVSSI